IWDLYSKLGHKLEAIQREIDTRLYQDSRLEGQSAPDVRTISKIIDELQTLSPSLVLELPRHVQEKRDDWSEIRLNSNKRPEAQETPAVLVLEFDPKSSEDQGAYTFADGQRAGFCCVRVWNRGESTARECVGRLTLLYPDDRGRLTQYNLHWAFDDPYRSKDVARPVDIPVGGYRRLDVAFSLPKSQEEASDGVEGRGLTTGRTFTMRLPSGADRGHSFEADGSGCWIATHLALSTHPLGDQHYLAPGEYVVKVEVACGHGQVEGKCFKIVSPRDWRGLNMQVVECPEDAA
ncbi:MAG: hypothetical protein V3R87_11315, partial [Dehalococcoidia bacterium]